MSPNKMEEAFKAYLEGVISAKTNKRLAYRTKVDYVTDLRLDRKNKDTGEFAYKELRKVIAPKKSFYEIQTIGEYKEIEKGLKKAKTKMENANKRINPDNKGWRVDVYPALTHYKEFLESREEAPIAEEISEEESKGLSEGAKRQITVNAYERNPEARKECIAHYGYKCQACGFDFEKIYGERGKGFIHVHHIVPLSKIGESYKVKPTKDLIPVCPNCHAMIHRDKENTLTVEKLKDILNKQRR